MVELDQVTRSRNRDGIWRKKKRKRERENRLKPNYNTACI